MTWPIRRISTSLSSRFQPRWRGRARPSYIESAVETLAPHIRMGSTVILESTTYPGTTEELAGPTKPVRAGWAASNLGYSPGASIRVMRSGGPRTPPKVVSGVDADSLVGQGVLRPHRRTNRTGLGYP
ncbi:MAG: hypothetical protein R2735_08740 [Microthrixaceae bacterium]